MMSTFYEILAVVSWGVLKLKMGLCKIPPVAERKKSRADPAFKLNLTNM